MSADDSGLLSLERIQKHLNLEPDLRIALPNLNEDQSPIDKALHRSLHDKNTSRMNLEQESLTPH